LPVQTPLPSKSLKSIESEAAQYRELNGNSGPYHSRIIATPFITDDELRARYGDAAELLIDALDRKVETQKAANHSRDRAAVEAAIKARCL
jgi:hypothetical protein